MRFDKTDWVLKLCGLGNSPNNQFGRGNPPRAGASNPTLENMERREKMLLQKLESLNEDFNQEDENLRRNGYRKAGGGGDDEYYRGRNNRQDYNAKNYAPPADNYNQQDQGGRRGGNRNYGTNLPNDPPRGQQSTSGAAAAGRGGYDDGVRRNASPINNAYDRMNRADNQMSQGANYRNKFDPEDRPMGGGKGNTGFSSPDDRQIGGGGRGGAGGFGGMDERPIGGKAHTGFSSPDDRPVGGGNRGGGKMNFDDRPIGGKNAGGGFGGMDDRPIGGGNRGGDNFDDDRQFGGASNKNKRPAMDDDRPIGGGKGGFKGGMDDRPIGGKSNTGFSSPDDRPVGGGRGGQGGFGGMDDRPIGGKGKGGFQDDDRPIGGGQRNKAQAFDDHDMEADNFQNKRQPANDPNKNSRRNPAQNRPPVRQPTQAEEEDERPIQNEGKNDAIKEAAMNDKNAELFECGAGCGRKFKAETLEKHEKICKKVFQTKRKQFDDTAMRLDGVVEAHEINQIKKKVVQDDKQQQKEKEKAKAAAAAKAASWKAQSEAFRANIKKAQGKQVTAEEEEAMKEVANAGLIPCPTCGRSFGEKAAEKHIPNCQARAKAGTIKPSKGATSGPAKPGARK